MPSLDPILRIGWQPSVSRGRSIEFDSDLRERVIQFEYTDVSSGADKGKLVMANHDLALFDHEGFRPGARLYVQWGYVHSMHPVRVITIEKAQGFRQLSIEGNVSEARRFLGIQRTRTFENATSFEVAETIARELGFTSTRSRSIERGSIVEQRRGITQAGETDMAFLLRLAGEVGAVAFVTGEVFHFHERSLGTAPIKTFTYFTDQVGTIIGDPSIEQSAQGRPGRVVRRGHSNRNRSTVEGVASNREDRSRPLLGEELPVTDPLGFDWTSISRDLGTDSESMEQTIAPPQEDAQADVSTTTAETEEVATSNARQAFRRGEREAVKIDLTIIGDPEVKADSTIRLEGIGQRYSGNYYIKEAVHSVGSGGYTTKVKLDRNGTSRSGSSGRSRRRVVSQATASLPAGADLPFSGHFDIWDGQGELNIDEPPQDEVVEISEVDSDGETRVRWQHRNGEPLQSRASEPWEEDW